MIEKNTPFKMIEIIHDTWPNLFRPAKDFYPPSELKHKKNETKGTDTTQRN